MKQANQKLPTSIYIVLIMTVVANVIATFIMIKYFLVQ